MTIGRTSDGRDADRLSVEGSGVQVRGLSLGPRRAERPATASRLSPAAP
ncbi:hypothetical protein ACRAWD_31245 [Caulobacter segnis]